MKISFKKFHLILALALLTGSTCLKAQDADQLLLKDFRPVSIYKIPVTAVNKAVFPVIDIHSHDYAQTEAEVDRWVKTMDECGIQKTIILSGATGDKFDALVKKYSKYPDRFDLWCGLDYSGYDLPGYGAAAVKELERCYKMGAKGVGELSDKGMGVNYSEARKTGGMHFDDARLKPLFDKCAELKLPVNIHLADPIWMYEKMDASNDGLMNAQTWRIDLSKPGILGFDALMGTLENVVKQNPKTTFIACHFANLNHDLERLGRMLDQYPNLYSDISARYAESATIPRAMQAFYMKYQDKLLYGTDMGLDQDMYRLTFRILESNDEHFYGREISTYHWAMNGFALQKDLLKKLYRDNATKLLSGNKK
ncbi:MAG TPA: amidohydrolase family protein [Prolixibacteraceae bacterium]|nr:amidohydrolase family protein [Prolixibacteraceae bacterium]